MCRGAVQEPGKHLRSMSGLFIEWWKGIDLNMHAYYNWLLAVAKGFSEGEIGMVSPYFCVTHRILHPSKRLRQGMYLKDGKTAPACISVMAASVLPKSAAQ